jgi:hypothetical protein
LALPAPMGALRRPTADELFKAGDRPRQNEV